VPSGWTKAEHALLQHGLQHYGAHSVESIRKYFLPAKTTDSILSHIRVIFLRETGITWQLWSPASECCVSFPFTSSPAPIR